MEGRKQVRTTENDLGALKNETFESENDSEEAKNNFENAKTRGCQNFCVSSDPLMAVRGRSACALLFSSAYGHGGNGFDYHLAAICRIVREPDGELGDESFVVWV